MRRTCWHCAEPNELNAENLRCHWPRSSGSSEPIELLNSTFPDGSPVNQIHHELNSAQELARRFNEDEAVWLAFERRRVLRRLLRSGVPLSQEELDRFDWEEAERQCRAVRAIGFFHE
jgi:hypothetical protein